MKSLYLLIIVIITFHQIKGQSSVPNKINSPDEKKGQVRSIRPYHEVIPANAIIKKGLISILQTGDKYYFQIPYNLLGKELLLVTRVSRGSARQVSPGDEAVNMIITFEQNTLYKCFLKKGLFTNYAEDTTTSTYQAVTRSNFLPIVASFDIETISPDSVSLIIDVTSYMLGDNEGFSLGPLIKTTNSLTSLAADKTYINSVTSFQKNIEIKTIKTYLKSPPVQAGVTNTGISTLSFELNTSIVLLPEEQMKRRFEDVRIGYFSMQQRDFDANPNGIKIRSYIKRWRLEPKENEIEKYTRGELVEPQKPIMFYIDPATPKKWVPYLIQGVNDWQVAFEQAGFKNAIIARTAPSMSEDSTWNLYDSRHSAIIYEPSEVENANGPSIADPRTGEILESHVKWHHNVMQLVHDWYMVQCGATDPLARKMVFDDSLMGRLIRFVISHEVGHAIGLLHNFAASSTFPTEKLRDKAWVEKNGFCPSIMDYARFNYVAQPEDNISHAGLLPRIGVYDKWAIQWGYRWFPQTTEESESSYLYTWTNQNINNESFFFGEPNADPRIQSEDLGNNSITAAHYGIKNLKRIMPHLLEWTKVPNEGFSSYTNLNRIYDAVQKQFITYLNHTVSYITGTYQSLKNADTGGPVYQPIPKNLQKQAMEFINKNVFTTPAWLIDTANLNRIGKSPIGIIGDLQDKVLHRLLFPRIGLLRMVSRNESAFGTDKVYTLLELLDDLKSGIWKELKTHQPIDMFRRNLQRTYIFYVIRSLTSEDSKSWGALVGFPISGHIIMTAHDVEATLSGHLMDLQKEISDALPGYKDKNTRYHLQYILDQIKENLNKRF